MSNQSNQDFSQSKQERNIEEIDLLKLLERLSKNLRNGLLQLLKSSIIGLLFARKFLFNYFKRIALVLSIGAAIGGGLSFLQKPRFESTALIHSEFLKGNSFVLEINKLDEYCRAGNYEVVASLFKLPEEKVKTLVGISAVPFRAQAIWLDENDPRYDSLMSEMSSSATIFEVIIALKTEEPDVDAIESGLAEYLKSNPDLQRNYLMNRRYLEVTKEKIMLELGNFDSLKQLVNRSLVSVENAAQGRTGASLDISVREQKDMLKDPLSIYERDFDYFQRLVQIDNTLIFDRELRVVSSFGKVKLSKTAHVVKYILYGVAIALSMFASALLLKALNDYLNRFEQKMNA